MRVAAFLALISRWRGNPLQLFTLLAGLALATALWSGVQAINAEARASYDAAAATLGEGQFDQLLPVNGGTIPQDTYIQLRRNGWLVSPVVEGRYNGIRLIGLDPLTAPGGLGPVQISDGADIATFLSGTGQIFGTDATLADLTDTDAALIPTPDMAPGTAITDIGVAQRLLELNGQITRLIVAPEQPITQKPLDSIAPDLTIRSAGEGSDMSKLTDSFHLNLTAFGFLSFAVGIFIVHGAIGLAFEQRRPIVRTLRALGLPLRTLVTLMATELVALALIAGTIGVALGYLIAAALLPDVAGTLQGLYGADVAGTLTLRPSWVLSGLGIAIGGTVLAATNALWSIARMPLLASAQPRAWAINSGRSARWQGALAAALLFTSAILFLGSSLAAGFGLLACLLIGSALALPLLLDRLLALGSQFSKGVLAQWFWADTRQQLPGLSLALAALLLAMAANVGVSTMVSSFRLTFTGFLDQRLASELYVVAGDKAEADRLYAFLSPKVDAILPLRAVEAELTGQPGTIYAARDHQTYRDNWRFLQSVPQVWDVLATGQGVLINEQLSRRAGLSLNDALVITPDTTLPVIGIYGDYGNTSAQAIITEDLFIRLFPDIHPVRFGLRLPAEDVPGLSAALKDDFGLADAAIINQAAIKSFSLDVFERTFTVTTALNILTLSVASFAILMSLLTLSTMRVPQLAPVWALGLTRRGLGQLELIRAVLLAAVTTLLALPLGLALAWALLSIVNVAAFGWKLPMFLFPVAYAKLGLLALAAALLAALWPAIRLSRTPPAALLKVFSHER